MTIRVAINGYGRIGRNILRALYEAKRTHEIQIVAITDLGDANTNAHLTRFDTVHGRFRGDVHVDGDAMVVNGDRILHVAPMYHSAALTMTVAKPCAGTHLALAAAAWKPARLGLTNLPALFLSWTYGM